jgi:hypothetical protein
MPGASESLPDAAPVCDDRPYEASLTQARSGPVAGRRHWAIRRPRREIDLGLIHVAVAGEDHDPILAAVRELGAERIVLIGTDDERDQLERLASTMGPLGVETEFRGLPAGDPLVATIQLVQRIVREHGDRTGDVVVNLGAADKDRACAMLSAAFVAGVKAVDMPEDEIVFLPILRFSYGEVVSEAKLDILQALDAGGGQVSKLRDLADEAGIQDSLASYHVRGGRDGEGLVDLGLVEVDRGHRGALGIHLTPMGELLARGLSPFVSAEEGA